MAERPDADALLARIQREERRSGRGRLRIYIGAFPGVGKTYAMLSEAHRRRSYGEDVVAGYVETHGRTNTVAMLGSLEVLPRKRVEYHGVVVEEMDVEAILERRPAVCLVDELAHTNAPGSEREKRYEDVDVILDAGIDVVATLNIQHLESLNDTVESLTGVRVRETLPDSVLDDADELILVDLTPEGARARMQHGHIYPPDQAARALDNFFRPENLAALREIALRRTAQEVDAQLDQLMREQRRHATEADEHVIVYIDDERTAPTIVRHAWRLAQGMHADLLVAYMRADRDETRQQLLERALELAEDLNGRICLLEGTNAAQAIAALVQAEGADHVVIEAHKPSGRWRLLRQPSLTDELLGLLDGAELHLVAPKTG